MLVQCATAIAKAAKSLQSCPTLRDPIDSSPPGSRSLGFSRQEHWSGLPFPSPMHKKWKVKVKSLSRVQLSATPWTATHQAPPSMGFSRQEYWSGVPLPSPSSMWNQHKNYEWDALHFCSKFSRSNMSFMLIAHLNSDKPHFKCSISTCD